MNTFELWKSGELQIPEQKGILKPTIIPACRAYSLFMSYRADGVKYEEALEKVADACCISRRTVKRAISLVTK